MLLRSIARKLNMTSVCEYIYLENKSSVPNVRRWYLPSFFETRRFLSNTSRTESESIISESYEKLMTLVDGCDYQHWLVVMLPPQGYPLRDHIINHYYIKTLALALGSEEEAKKSIYSVSTKYYYSFSCKIPEYWIHKIKALPNVRWVLPDSYLPPQENYYGGEPIVDGKVFPFDDKYHVDWLRDGDIEKCRRKSHSRKARRKEQIEADFRLNSKSGRES